MKKWLFIVCRLVAEAEEVSNEAIEKEVLGESTIPWVKEIVKVTVLEEYRFNIRMDVEVV